MEHLNLSAEQLEALRKKYQEMSLTLQPYERIFIDVGQPDTFTGSGYFREPRKDHDGLPLMEVYWIPANKKRGESRLEELAWNGWKEVNLVEAPAAVKRK